jgi:hypothetical protein
MKRAQQSWPAAAIVNGAKVQESAGTETIQLHPVAARGRARVCGKELWPSSL